MTGQLETSTQRLRELILLGAFRPGEKLGEAAVAERLDVSRTIARLAMGALEPDGLLHREANRGYRVRAFTIDDVTNAIEVRGELEAMGARVVAERGLPTDTRLKLEQCLSSAERMLAGDMSRVEDRVAWIEMNGVFHDAIMGASGNQALISSIENLSSIPLAAARAIVFDLPTPERTLFQLRASHDDHVRVFDALLRRQSMRAAAIMREHAYKSSENKRTNFADIKGEKAASDLPGLALVID